ncbi:aspartate aminotransferase family protein [Pseudohongiella spirulinae]|uniref:Adenosylmethionine-8-amino-7-oxononanoate aminotransferase n=1 Tax=Pseudohongiella spirulinae TaxID=1249552 RepID=A0A0S2KE36_9GAMM|nr:aspartate aminotransferase family protein [Pseudohongiella spirulinae]ALO46382.1 Adenosylmethionine-8-amino-7-oxononanoate aminotransferase [Pseudohongiella spirulinae]
MSQVFYRSPKTRYPMVQRADGVYLYDQHNKAYLDGSGGAAVSCLGYNHPQIIRAIKAQLDKVPFAHSAFFTNEPQEELAQRLADRFPQVGARVYFLSGGSEANETALKLVRQYWLAKGCSSKYKIISRQQSYHGNTLGALSVSGNVQRRKTYGPMLQDWPRIMPCYSYRHQREDESDAQFAQRAANALEQAILEAGPETVAAFIAEPIVGATLGVVLPATDYFRRIREICDQYQVLLILDEVMCGAGRSGHYFAFEQENVVPDVVTLAKGLGGGYQPLGACICRQDIHDTIVDACGSFAHGHTYIGHATACAAGVAVMDVLEQQNLLDRVQSSGKLIRNALRTQLAEHPYVGDIRGSGLFIGIELVSDRTSRRAPANSAALASTLKQRAMDTGLIIYPGHGSVDGSNGTHILLAPPFIYQDQHIDELLSKLSSVLDHNELKSMVTHDNTIA